MNAKKIVDNKLLKTLVPFGELKEEQFAKLAGQYKVETFKAGHTLFKQGERDARTYFLLSGQVNLRYSDGSIKSIIADTPQAQYALVPVRPRQATATAKTPITVLSLDANLFEDILSWGNENQGVFTFTSTKHPGLDDASGRSECKSRPSGDSPGR